MEMQNALIDKFDDILVSFRNAHIGHLGMMQAMHEIAASNYFRCHGEDGAADLLKEENTHEFMAMRITMGTNSGRGKPQPARFKVPRLNTTNKRLTGIVIPKGDGKLQKRQED